jgi:hypothetical protein
VYAQSMRSRTASRLLKLRIGRSRCAADALRHLRNDTPVTFIWYRTKPHPPSLGHTCTQHDQITGRRTGPLQRLSGHTRMAAPPRKSIQQ